MILAGAPFSLSSGLDKHDTEMHKTVALSALDGSENVRSRDERLLVLYSRCICRETIFENFALSERVCQVSRLDPVPSVPALDYGMSRPISQLSTSLLHAAPVAPASRNGVKSQARKLKAPRSVAANQGESIECLVHTDEVLSRAGYAAGDAHEARMRRVSIRSRNRAFPLRPGSTQDTRNVSEAANRSCCNLSQRSTDRRPE